MELSHNKNKGIYLHAGVFRICSYSRITHNKSYTFEGVDLTFIHNYLQDGATTVSEFTILFQFTVLLSLGQLAQLGWGGWEHLLLLECKITKLIFCLKAHCFDHRLTSLSQASAIMSAEEKIAFHYIFH